MSGVGEDGADGLAGESEAVRREIGVAGAGVCCCVLVHLSLRAHGGRRMIICNGPTTGPDDPFCVDCEDRHTDHPAVVVGASIATQRLRGPSGGGGAG